MGGPTALRGEALREALPDFYARAVTDTEVDPIDQPEIDITSGDESGAVSFDAVVLVRPTVAIPGYQGLVVTLPTLEVTDEEVTAQLDRLRATSGELVEVARPARDGDQVTIDIHGTRAGATGDDAIEATSTPRTSSTRWGAAASSPSSTSSCAAPRPATSSTSTPTLGPEGETGLVPGAGQGRQGARPPRGDRRVGRRGLRVRHGRRADGRPRRAAPPAARRPGADGPRAADGRGAGRAGHRGDPRAAGRRGVPRADPRPQPPPRGARGWASRQFLGATGQ